MARADELPTSGEQALVTGPASLQQGLDGKRKASTVILYQRGERPRCSVRSLAQGIKPTMDSTAKDWENASRTPAGSSAQA